MAGGLSFATLWTQLQLPQTLLLLLYHLVTAHMLWYAPFYAWMLFISAWARRTPLLWTVIPPLAIGVFEKIAFQTSHFAELLNYRFSGGPEAMTSMMGDMPFEPGMHIAPVAFLTAPGLWGGLLVAAALLFAAARVRRYRSPI
jgi:ABC-2 type transport system permease protein